MKRIIHEIGKITKQLLRQFYRTTKHKPESIVVYRDGVSEGQFSHVLDSELRGIKTACNEVERGYNPKVTFVVLQKRIHTRLFPIHRDNMDRSGNCKSGTVVDTDVVNSQMNDFFVQSHSGIQGTIPAISLYCRSCMMRIT